MNKNENFNVTSKLDINKPIIFAKKSNSISKVIPLNVMKSDYGLIRHFPPAGQEWFNSVYAYNNNYIKSLPIADNNLMNLLKSYFNLFFKEKTVKSKGLLTRHKRMSVNKVFVGKGELKHTSSKVIITLYVYNQEKKHLTSVLRNFIALQYPKKPLVPIKKGIQKDNNMKNLIVYNRPLTIEEYLELSDNYTNYLSSIYSSFLSITIKLLDNTTKYLDLITKYYSILNILVENKVLNNDEKVLIFNDKVNSFFLCLAQTNLKYSDKGFLNYSDFFQKYTQIFEYKSFINKLRMEYTKSFSLDLHKLLINDTKFETSVLSELTRLVSNIYNKDVEFNIVNLKKLHLNSDIFTQAVSIKLKNRNNNVYRVLKSSLSNVKLSDENRRKGKYLSRLRQHKEELLINKIRNTKINSMFANVIAKNDPLNMLLLNIFPTTENLKRDIKSRWSNVKRSISLKNYILRSLKHIDMAGIRIEAKGRLTRRFTASKSVFKMK
jgi:hypothetical protein